MNAASKNILIIDDEEAIVLLLTTIFELYGFSSHSCSQARNAVAVAAKLQPDLIILDVAMPDKDGYEICRELKANQATSKIPVLMLTALALTQDRKKGIAAGADSFIFKPFDPLAVIQEVSRLLA